MEENFKLAELPYERITIESFQKEAEKIIEGFKAAKSGEEQFLVHKKYYGLMEKMRTAIVLTEMRHSGDVSDKFYEAEQDYYDEISPKIESFEVKYKKMLFESEYREYLESKIGKVPFKNIEIQIKSFNDVLIPLKQEENNLTSKYNKLVAQTKVEFRGETLNLSLLGKYVRSKDRATRIEASRARSEKLLTIANELDEIYDKLVKNRNEQAKAMGYENYVELGYYNMKRNSYDKNDVANFRNQVKKYLVPLASKMHEERRKRLGLEKLEYVDEGVYFLDGNPAPTGTADDIFVSGQKMYSELSPETKEFFDFMLKHELFDVLGRANKIPGGFMDMLLLYKAPIVFANFNGTSGDIDVITHECGHAFQGFITRNDEIMENNDITSETAEVHSMSMEFFAEKWMELFFGHRADDYRKMHLEDAIAFIPYGSMVDEFQEIIYTKPELTPAERREVWKQLEKEYKPHLDFNDDKFYGDGRTWQLQQHIYNWPFYYIDYCLAQTCALQFKTRMDEDYKVAWDKYLAFCLQSAKDYFPNMLHNVGLKSPFEDGFMKEIVEKIKL
ncbi:M3 family oligoendopeptidase [Inconstantimicrobium mannanitabidum]|uniref:Oligoendopeptidase F n=1 Tax=Inconstantimicrobium mannanitabidum TaxID=1604901 RepID=A0ACB5RBA4_9CLOT|nr:M3 family oligoendopeptidase [Clostridium sp. TW13]GKX66498.1 oligoendopeptidase F [Clostridium sp. TW13]